MFPVYGRKPENVTNAVAGDIIGVYDTGTYQVGNTLTVGKNKFEFEPLPTFTLKSSWRCLPRTLWSKKSFHKGIEQLVQEGAIQLYKHQTGEYMLELWGNFSLKSSNTGWENKEYNAEVVMSPMGKKDRSLDQTRRLRWAHVFKPKHLGEGTVLTSLSLWKRLCPPLVCGQVSRRWVGRKDGIRNVFKTDPPTIEIKKRKLICFRF